MSGTVKAAASAVRIRGRRIWTAAAYDPRGPGARGNSNLEEAPERERRAGGAEQEPGSDQGERVERERQGMDVRSAADMGQDRRQGDRLADDEEDDGEDG